MTIKGTRGNDTLKGTAQADIFDLSLGGDDTVTALGGNDTFIFKGAFTAQDQINGGGGTDVLSLAGDYSHGVAFGATTIVGVETITLGAHHDYKLTTNDANVATNKALTIDGSTLGTADTLTFNGAHETNGHFDIIGGKGNDVLTGGAKNDIFDLTHGGADTANGGDGNDVFNFGNAYTTADVVNGGTGTNSVTLDGSSYSDLLISHMTGVETLTLAAGNSYGITTADSVVASGQVLTVDGSKIGAGDSLNFNGAAETNGNFVVIAGAGDDVLTGGSGGDIFEMGSHFTAADTINGGAGIDFVKLDGDTNVTMAASTIQNIDSIYVAGAHTYNLTTVDANIAAGETLSFEVSSLQDSSSFTLNASAETDGSVFVSGFTNLGHYDITGGAGNDFIDLSDGDASTTATIRGSLGGDTVYGAAAEGGMTTFIYTSASQSTGSFLTHDFMRFVHFGTDKMEVSGFTDAGGFTYAGNTATINADSFDTDLAAAVTGHFNANGVCEVIAGGGNQSGNAYLVLDINGDAAYTNGQDYVFQIDNSDTGIVTPGFFT